MNSTPVRPASTMRLTAFVPPPPTPTTLITARKFPVWSLTLKGARPEALVEPLFVRPIRRRRVRGFFSAVNGNRGALTQPRPETLGLPPAIGRDGTVTST